MVSPQERHTKVGMSPGVVGERSMAGVEGVYCDTCDSAGTGGSATELSVSPTPGAGCR